MAKNSIRQYDATAANNLDVAGISMAEGVTLPSYVNNAVRAEMSHLAQYLAEMSFPTVGGTADALTLTPTTALAALADNVVYTGTIGASPNATTTPTLVVSGLASKLIRKMSGGVDVPLAVGDLPALTQFVFVFKAAANSAVGAWIALNTQIPTITPTAITTVASAGTTPIGAAASSEVNITGTTTITAFDTVAAGTVREGYFSGILTLTHNGTSLLLPGGKNITTAANDRFRALSLGSGNWIVLIYTTTSGAINVPSQNGGQLAGFRNGLINGSFDVWQRGTSITSAVTTPGITADRWLVNQAAGTVALTIAQQAAPAAGVNFSQRVQRNAANTNVNVIHDMQVVESINCTRFQGQTVTLSFYAKCGANFSAASSLLVSKVLTGTGVDQGCASAVAGTWTGQATTSTQNNTLTTSRQQFSQTLTIPSGATEIAVDLSFTPVGTAGANDWFEIDSVQLEPGPYATPLEIRSYGLELSLCQRYLWRRSSDTATITGPDFLGNGVMRSTTVALVVILYPLRMRGVPTFTTVNSANSFYVQTSGDNNTATCTAVCGISSAELSATIGAISSNTPVNFGFASTASTAFIDFNAEIV